MISGDLILEVESGIPRLVANIFTTSPRMHVSILASIFTTPPRMHVSRLICIRGGVVKTLATKRRIPGSIPEISFQISSILICQRCNKNKSEYVNSHQARQADVKNGSVCVSSEGGVASNLVLCYISR